MKSLKPVTSITMTPGMTALEIWCLAMIAIVFQSLISYVIILVRCPLLQDHHPEPLVRMKFSARVGASGVEGEVRDMKLEGVLVLTVLL